MRISPKQFLSGLLYAAPILLLALASCGGGGGSTTTPVVAPTVAPTGLTAAAGCTAINLNWIGVTGATGYNVYETASGVTTTKTSATTSYTDAGLIQGINYSYQVAAVNSAGQGPTSTSVNTKTKSGCTVMGGSIQGNPLNLTTAVSTLAGTAPYQGYVDATGAKAQFTTPGSVTTDGTNLYVADAGNNVIRQIVISTGAVTTLAGAGPLISGNGTATNDDGTGPAAKFNGPQGITTDGTYLYVADTKSNTIRKIVISSGAVTTIANGFNLPAAITTDGTYLYVTDTVNNQIVQLTLVGASTGKLVSVFSPQGITYNSSDSALYVTGASGVSSITPAASMPTAFILTAVTGLSYPQGITTDGTYLYVASSGNGNILQISTSGGTPLATFGTGIPGYQDGTASAAQFRNPNGITTDGVNLYIVDTGNSTIRKIQ